MMMLRVLFSRQRMLRMAIWAHAALAVQDGGRSEAVGCQDIVRSRSRRASCLFGARCSAGLCATAQRWRQARCGASAAPRCASPRGRLLPSGASLVSLCVPAPQCRALAASRARLLHIAQGRCAHVFHGPACVGARRRLSGTLKGRRIPCSEGRASLRPARSGSVGRVGCLTWSSLIRLLRACCFLKKMAVGTRASLPSNALPSTGLLGETAFLPNEARSPAQSPSLIHAGGGRLHGAHIRHSRHRCGPQAHRAAAAKQRPTWVRSGDIGQIWPHEFTPVLDHFVLQHRPNLAKFFWPARDDASQSPPKRLSSNSASAADTNPASIFRIFVRAPRRAL